MYIASTRYEAIIDAVGAMERAADDVVMLMLGEHNRPDIKRLVDELNRHGIPFFGGIFPGVIDGQEKFESGAVLTTLPALEKPFLIKDLTSQPTDFQDFGAAVATRNDRKHTAIVLVDGLAANIALFLSEMFNRFGNSINYLGGGAGSLSLKQEPCLITPEGIFQDAAIVTFLKQECRLGVRHGWEKIADPVIATKTHKNIIQELNWKNAFDVYRHTVEADAGKTLTGENFFTIAKGYPFGIIKEAMEDIVRDPIAVNDRGELICVGEVPENTVLSILEGYTDSLILAAGQAADDCLQAGAGAIDRCLMVDCISRVIFLEQDYARELEQVNHRLRSIGMDQGPVGMLTLGEISSYGDGFVEFFNKTIVVGVFYRN
ncbi:MAG: FIST C-terminal domain-containing protein [Desulfobacterales bacterium]|nr:MAG: FIST C-terminal domain-containing protein [Desulfobacterales bacterium]